MKRLMEKMVFSGLVIACLLATWPTKRSPFLVNPTTEGVVRPPSSLGMTLGSPPSITATTELVVPKSIPIILDIVAGLLNLSIAALKGHGFSRAEQTPFYCHHERPLGREGSAFLTFAKS